MNCYKCGNQLKISDKFCANCGTPFTYEPPNGKGLIVFKRNCRLGFALKMHLYLDDIKIGVLKNKSELNYPVEFGNHKITGHLKAGKKETVYIEVSPENNTVIIDCWVDISAGITGNVKFSVL